MPTEARLERLQLEDLVPHPDQDKFFRPYTPYESKALTDDIANHIRRTEAGLRRGRRLISKLLKKLEPDSE